MMPVESFEELSRGEQSSSEVIGYTCKHAVIWLTASRETGRRIPVCLWAAHKGVNAVAVFTAFMVAYFFMVSVRYVTPVPTSHRW